MALASSVVWRVRPGGTSTGGGGYDGTTYAGGTDYSQQDAPQTSGTAGTAAGTTAFSDASGAFTAAMVGNLIQIASGAGFTAGFYAVAAYSSSTAITLDRSPGTGSAAVWKLGGALGGSTYYPLNHARSGGAIAAGHIVYIKGSSAAPSSPDYSWSSGTWAILNPANSGDTTAGAIKFIVDPSQPTWRPYISRSDGDLFIANGGNNLYFDGLIFRGTSATNSRYFDTAQQWTFKNCTFNMNDLGTAAAFINGQGNIFANCEFFSKVGSTPTSQTGASIASSSIHLNVIGCHFHDMGMISLEASYLINVIDCVFTNSIKPYIVLDDNSSTTYRNSVIRNNTFNGKTASGDDGVVIAGDEILGGLMMIDNIFSNFATASKAGVRVTANSGTTAINDRVKMFIDYNNYYNNTSNIVGMSLGPNDLTLDPGYFSSTDLTLLGTNLQGKAFPRGPIMGG